MPETLDSVSRQRKQSILPQPLPYGIGSVRKACLDAEALASEGDLLAVSLMRRHYNQHPSTNAALPSSYQRKAAS